MLFIKAVVESDLSQTKTETDTAKFFRDQDRSRMWLRDWDRQSSRPRPRPVPSSLFFQLKKNLRGSNLLIDWFYEYINWVRLQIALVKVIMSSKPLDEVILWRLLLKLFLKNARGHFMETFTEVIFEECPWPTKRKRAHMSPNSGKLWEAAHWWSSQLTSKHENAPAIGLLLTYVTRGWNDYPLRRGDSIKMLSNEVGL